MPIFLNPFRKHDVSDFPDDVYEPLEGAARHPSVAVDHEPKGLGSLEDPDPVLKGHNGSALEALAAEIDLDIAASGHDSAYDRKSKVINKAIQDIGMGSYQWKLFALCGFGWLADK